MFVMDLPPTGRLRCCRVRSESEAQKHLRRRRKRKREKISKAHPGSSEPHEPAAPADKEEEEEGMTAADELAPMQVSPQPALVLDKISLSQPSH